MDLFNKILLILHFIGLAMGLSVSISNIVMMGIITNAAPGERPVLARFPPAMSRVGRVGLVLLWLTGLTMVYTRWNGFDGMPWQLRQADVIGRPCRVRLYCLASRCRAAPFAC